MRFLLFVMISCCCLVAHAQEDQGSQPLASEYSPMVALEGDPLFVRSYRGIAKIITKDEFEKITTSEIEYISVIKDPSSIHIYGDKAKHGVILVVMKGGSGAEKFSARKRRQK